MIDARHHVSKIAATPVAVVGVPKLLPIAAAAARIGTQHRIAPRREGRNRIRAGIAVERLREDPHRPAVDDQQQWITLAFLVADRVSQQSFDFQVFGRFPTNQFGVPRRRLRQIGMNGTDDLGLEPGHRGDESLRRLIELLPPETKVGPC